MIEGSVGAVDEFMRRQAERVVQTRRLRRLLAQQDVWQVRSGSIVQVAEMEPLHARRVLAMLERGAVVLHDGECAEYLFMPEPNGEQAGYNFADERDRVMMVSPRLWLTEQPLVKALRTRASGRPVVADAG